MAAPPPTGTQTCTIAALDAGSTEFRRLLAAAVKGLRTSRLRTFATRRGVRLRNVLTCDGGRVTARIALAGRPKTVLATGALTFRLGSAGRVSVRLKPTKAGKRRFAQARKLRVRVTARVDDPVGKAASYSTALTLKR